jgi:hypothetical protein
MYDGLIPRSGSATAAAYLYLLRVPILMGVILFAFPLFALGALGTSVAKPIFENMFVLGWRGTLVTTFAAFIVSWSIVLSALVVLVNAEERFGVGRWLTQDTLRQRQKRVRWIIGILLLVLSGPMIFGQFLQTDWRPDYRNLRSVFGGAAAAYLLAYLALIFAMLLSPRGTDVCTEIFPGPKLLREFLQTVHDHHVLGEAWPRLTRFFLSWPADWNDGYIDKREFTDAAKEKKNLAHGLPWSGFWLTFSFWALTFLVYIAIDFYKQWAPNANDLPALIFVLLLLLNVNWGLCAATFFFDRFRLPLLFLFAVLAILATNITSSADNYYRLRRGDLRSIKPHEVLERRIADHKPIIIVTTAGGGIQANAWTVRVLTGLQAAVQPLGNFADSVAMVSSVSGGATGALFFLNQYKKGPDFAHPGFNPTGCKDSGRVGCDELAALVSTAEIPSLDDVAWALAYRDVPRVVFPYFPGVVGSLFSTLGERFLTLSQQEGLFLDRGRMMERSWAERGISGRLSSWQDEGLTEGWRPASIFNATIAETGEPFLFSTTDLDPPLFNESGRDPETVWRRPQPITFARFYPHSDIDLVTAARVASGFPYVLPAPRALHESDPENHDEQDPRFRYHVIDGGYYDNYGVDSAVQWLDQALKKVKEPPPVVLVLQIRSFPGERLPDVDVALGKPMPRDFMEALPRYRGWPFQAYSPLLGLLQVRSTGQLLHDRDHLLLLRDKWGKVNGRPRIRFASFEFGETNAPLSFKMNTNQMCAIDKAWQQVVNPLKDEQAALNGKQTDSINDPCAFKDMWNQRAKLNEPKDEQTDLTQVRCLFDESLPGCPAVIAKEPW